MKTIELVKVYHCGYCENNLKTVFRKTASSLRQFSARVFLFRHSRHGLILLDTGYTRRVLENGLSSVIYNALNPVTCQPGDELVSQLKADGLSPAEIGTIILSHLHPDHVGGLQDFPQARLLCSARAAHLPKSARLLDLVFPNLLPDNFSARAEVFSGDLLRLPEPLGGLFETGWDVFADQSLWAVPLEGHACGQVGLFLPEAGQFFVADACWGREFLDKKLRLVSRWIQHDFAVYAQNQEKLLQLHQRHPEISIFSTHGLEEAL